MPQDLRIPATHFLQTAFRPAVVTWNRLEGRPRREDFTRSLRAEVRDPLWMLCRQWQLGEFRAADAGSAVLAKVQVDTTRLDHYVPHDSAAVAYDDTLPLETRVEAERIDRGLRTRIQMGRHWRRLLDAGAAAGRHGLYLDEYGFLRPTEPEALAQLLSDARAHALFRAVENRVVDGDRLLTAIESGQHADFVAASPMSTGEKAAAIAAATEFRAWFRRLYRAPDEDERTAWAPSYLEYRFACAAARDESGERQIVLTADEYHHGRLDWYSFDVDARPDTRLEPADGTTIPLTTPTAENPITFIPNRIEFGGVPNVRWWELEDRRTDLGGLRASTTDLALLMLAEFGLVFGNDWSVVPYDLGVGSLATVRGIVVTDVFGVRTFVRAAGTSPADAWQRWSIFDLAPRNGELPGARPLFLAPAVAKSQEGEPIERVLLARDEMANMVWAIEDVVPGAIGDGTAGYAAATDLSSFLSRDLPVEADPPEMDARIRYRLGTTVPENWIPFIAVHEPGSNREVRLQRAAMPRLVPGGANALVEPRGAFLREGLDRTPRQPYFVHEEEARQAGSVLVRAYQRARWWDGRTYTWLGRRKLTGRGGASSALEFDRIEPVPRSTP